MGTTSPATIGGMATNPQRLRIIFDASDRLRRAIKLKAAELDLSTSETIVRILEGELQEHLQRADRLIADEVARKPGRAGRKTKGDE